MKKEIADILAEMERWNEGDRMRYRDGSVDFDGTGPFAARKKRIQELKKLLEDK